MIDPVKNCNELLQKQTKNFKNFNLARYRLIGNWSRYWIIDEINIINYDLPQSSHLDDTLEFNNNSMHKRGRREISNEILLPSVLTVSHIPLVIRSFPPKNFLSRHRFPSGTLSLEKTDLNSTHFWGVSPLRKFWPKNVKGAGVTLDVCMSNTLLSIITTLKSA